MRLGRKSRIAILSVAAVAAGGALTAYILAGSVPSYYRPARLGPAEKDSAMREFRRRLMDFSNDGQKNEPFTWSLTQDQLNRYLGSMDEIAVQGGAKPGSAHRAMESAGLAEPAVVLDGGHVRLVARSLQYQRVVSIDLNLAIGPDGLLRVNLAGARVGRLPMPTSLVRSLVERLRAKFAQGPGGPASAPATGGLDSAQAALALQRVISAIDGEPIPTEMTWKITTRKRVRVSRIDIDAGRLTLHVVPVLRPEENGRQSPME